MESNLLYKDYSIFTKTPQIYLNLNTTLTKNLNVENITNLNVLNVQNYSNLKGQLISDNIYTNQDLIVNGTTTLNNTTNLNSNIYLHHTEESSNITSGTLIVKGGVGISKNVFIGGNTTVENNLNILKIANINENLNVLNTTTLNKLNVLDDTNISKNLNVNEFTTIHKNLNIQSNTITQQSNIVYKDIIGHNSLTVEKDSQFKSNLTVYGNFAVLGSRFNIVSEQTLVADPLVVFGINQSQTFDNSYGGFVVNHSDKYSGLVRQPSADGNFYLYKNISQIPDENDSTKFNPDLTNLDTHNEYGNIFVNNINTNKITSNIIHNSGIGSFGSLSAGVGTFNGKISALNGITGDLTGNATSATTAITIFNTKDVNSTKPNYINFIDREANNNNIDTGIGTQLKTDDKLSYIPSTGQINANRFVINNPYNDPDNKFMGNLEGYIKTAIQTDIKTVGTLTHLNVGETSNNEAGKITTKDLSVTNNVSVANDVVISGNLVVSGNNAIVITNHFDINDPIFTISNNSPNYDRGMLVNNGKLNINDPDLYSGLIRKDNDSNFYLLDDISNPLAQIVPTTNKSTLILKNINTTQYSHLNGVKFVENNDITNTNDTIATFPNNSSSTHIEFYKKTKFENDLLINSNINLNGNLSVSDKFILLDTNSFISHGSTQLLGNTTITGHLDISKSVIDCDHVNIRSFFNNLGHTRTKNLDADNVVIVDKLRFPVRETITTNNGADFPATKTGYVIFNKTKGLFEGHNGRDWIVLGIDPNSTTSTTIAANLNVGKNINVTDSILISKNLEVEQDALIKQNLIIPVHNENNSTLDSKKGSIYFNSDKNLFYGRDNSAWLPLGGINPYTDTTIEHNLNIKKNINVDQNINVAFNITSNNSITKHNLIVPIHSEENSVNLKSNPGSIYYNITEHLFYGHNEASWAPLGGINPNEDTTIKHNLIVKKNINVDQNINVAFNITANNCIAKNNLIVPTYNNTSNGLDSTKGSIYFNSSTNLFYGHDNSDWLPLGGINPYTDTTIDHNLNVVKKTVTNSLLVNGISQFNGYVYVDNKLTSKELIIPGGSNSSNNDSGKLFINYNGSSSQLKLRLNGYDNVIPFNNNPIIQLSSSTDLFQFYNVQYNQPVFGNRITGLNDPAFNSFTKFYTLKEFTFFQETLLTNIEFYVSHSIHNVNLTELNIKLEIIRTRDSTTTPVTPITETVFTDTFTNVSIATVIYSDLILDKFTSTDDVSDNKFLKNDKIKLKLTLINNFNGHEIFIRLHGESKIHPQVDKLHILDETNATTNNTPALLVEGGARFKKDGIFTGSVSASNFSPFTGCHTSKLITPINYDTQYSYYNNNTYIYKSGLIVSVDNSTVTHIDSSQFNIKISNTVADKTVLGVINSYLDNQNYSINSLGEGAIWVSNINGDVNNGDYIMSSNILGYGCKQNDDILHSYTVAKCCSVINWSSINSYINHYNNTYKIAFVACTYHCG